MAEILPSSAQAGSSGDRQGKLNSFYSLDSLVNIDVDIDPDIWDKLRNAEPKGGWGYQGPRYDWHRAKSVTIQTDQIGRRTFDDVGIIKKSFMGSKNADKPSFRLKFEDSNKDEIEDLIGTSLIIMNNCVQDPDYIRQPFGYRLFREAGVPVLRCNFACVKINGEDAGVYVNIEGFKKPMLANRFGGNVDGNGYEITYQQDIHPKTWRYTKDYGVPSFEGFSKVKNEKDIKFLAEKIEKGDFDAVQKVVDIDNYIKFWAMETLLKHWDGFHKQINNTFIYSDSKAVEEPSVNSVKFKFVPSGIDQILRSDQRFTINKNPALANMLWNNATTRKKLHDQIQQFQDGRVFSKAFVDEQLKRCETVMKRVLPDYEVDEAVRTMREEIASVKRQANKYFSDLKQRQ